MSDTEPFLVSRRDGVLTLSFNRPEHGNAMPSAAVPMLIELFRSVPGDASVRALLIRGEGRNFSAGGDVQGFGATLKQAAEERRADFHARLDRARDLVAGFLAIDVPVVAACRGAAAGAGLMYLLGADIVLADDSAIMVFAHQRVGLVPDSGVSFLLPRVVGQRRAMELVLRAGKIDAAEGLRLGIVSEIVPADALEDEARKIALRLARGPSATMRAAKRLLRAAAENSLDDHLVLERDAIVAGVGEPAFVEGVSAFLEKRPADFSGM